MQHRPHGELAHPCPRGPVEHRGGPGRGLRVAVAPAELAERVEDVDVEPDVRVGQAVGARPGVDEHGEGSVHLTLGLGQQGQPAGGDALPAGVADLAGPGEGLLEGAGGGVEVAEREPGLTEHGLGPGQEREPVVTLGQVAGGRQDLGGLDEVAPQQADAAQHRQAERLPPRLARVAARPGPRPAAGRWRAGTPPGR